MSRQGDQQCIGCKRFFSKRGLQKHHDSCKDFKAIFAKQITKFKESASQGWQFQFATKQNNHPVLRGSSKTIQYRDAGTFSKYLGKNHWQASTAFAQNISKSPVSPNKRKRVESSDDQEFNVGDMFFPDYADFGDSASGIDNVEVADKFDLSSVASFPPNINYAASSPDSQAPEENRNIPVRIRIIGRFKDVVIPRINLYVREVVNIILNQFGIRRQYKRRVIDSETISLEEDLDQASDSLDHTNSNTLDSMNASQFLLQFWYWMYGAKKTIDSRAKLVDMITSQFFRSSDLIGTNWRKLDKLLGTAGDHAKWQTTNIEIPIPVPHKSSYDPLSNDQKNAKLPKTNIFQIPNFTYRSLSSLIHDQVSMESAKRHWNWEPYTEIWESGSNVKGEPCQQRLYGELYSSDSWLQEHEKIQKLRSPDGFKGPKVVLPLMIWSDGLSLGNFTDQTLHPFYVAFGNESKYNRGKPSARALHTVAYLPKIPDNIHDCLRNLGQQKGASPKVLSHCRREYFHAGWRLLLDEDFIKGYKEGWVIQCEDGVTRHIFPRFFTYSADYPEKVTISCIRDKSTCLCPRCGASKDQADQMGTQKDIKMRIATRRTITETLWIQIQKARHALYYRGLPFTSKYVDEALKKRSLVPTLNVFVERLGVGAVDPYAMMVSDFMHEIELGVWKDLIHHIVRIFHCMGEEYVRSFDKRIRFTPTFGDDTIRRFRNDISLFKKMTADSYEDLLQVIIPAIDGLLPEPHNEDLRRLLFVFATYHGLGKLRLHTEATLDYWQHIIILLGKLMRNFRDSTAIHFKTKETPKEVQDRARRQGGRSSGRKAKCLNLNTYKFHAIGDGPSTVREFGTLDSYSTSSGELMHKVPKSYWNRSSKNDDSAKGVAMSDDRVHTLLEFARANKVILPESFRPSIEESLPAPSESKSDEADKHYHIACSIRDPIKYVPWVQRNREREPKALDKFVEKLKNHILNRLMDEQTPLAFPDFTPDDRQKLYIANGRLYGHQRLRIFYTTYDMQRETDLINMNAEYGKRDVMVASMNADDPFLYARVLGVYHCNVSHSDKPEERIDVLWVRWFTRVNSGTGSGWNQFALDQLTFDPDLHHQFGFLDPSRVIRACHIIPAWNSHRLSHDNVITTDYAAIDGDYNLYYVNRFVDRDMLMRFLGGGVGHQGEGAYSQFQGRVQQGSEEIVVDEPIDEDKEGEEGGAGILDESEDDDDEHDLLQDEETEEESSSSSESESDDNYIG